MNFNLSRFAFGIPFCEAFEAPADHEALWFSRGFVSAKIREEATPQIGSRWRLDVTADDGKFDDNTLVGECTVEDRDGVIGQSWRLRRRRSHSREMSAGDPHDEPHEQRSKAQPGPVKKRSAAARRSDK